MFHAVMKSRAFLSLAVLLAVGLLQPRQAGAANFNPFQPKASAGSASAAKAPVSSSAASSAVLVPAAKQNEDTTVTPGVVITISNAGTIDATAPNATAVFVVSLNKPAATTITVSFATTDGTARAGFDYVAKSGTITFQPGQTSHTISVSILADGPDGPNNKKEDFFVNLFGATGGATIANNTGTATILIGQRAKNPKFSVSGATTFQGTSGTKVQFVKVRLSFPVNADVSCWFQTIDGSAHAGRDYVRVAHRIQFAPNQTVLSIPITIIGNTSNPGSRSFLVGIALPVGASISNDTATVTLLKGG